MTSDLQRRIDAQAYPPTHTYRLMLGAPPVPTGILAERWEMLWQYWNSPPDGSRFLDVGCSKGFFSLTAAACGYSVEAIDTDPAAVALCRDLGINAAQYSFREWPPPTHRFDLVFLGNVNHYCYQEAGWSFAQKLAAITADHGRVIIEGPIDAAECADVQRMTPALTAPQLHDFTWERFTGAMLPWFDLDSRVPAVAYTPGRYVTVWTRRATPMRSLMGPPLPIIAENEASGWRVLGLGGGEVAKVMKRRADQFPITKPIDPPATLARSLEFASVSSMASPRVANVPGGGWLEPFIPAAASNPLEPGWRRRPFNHALRALEREAFAAACARNAELAKMGMVDVDMGPANWTKTPAGWITVDKNSVWPIATLAEDELGPEGKFMRTLEYACNPVAVPRGMRVRLAEALATRNSREVEKAMQDAAKAVMW